MLRRSCTATVMLCASAGLAQTAEPMGELRGAGYRVSATPIILPAGAWGFGGGQRDCDTLSAYTDANFEGGSFVVQAGFSEHEVAATSFTIAADQFPIRIDLYEVIVATAGTIEATTTEWSVLFWEGTPSTGTLIFEASSDDLILPHIQLPAGPPAGVNLAFSIDPNDPEQIILADNGTHTFSVGFRIDKHNHQVQNPCLVSPPEDRNAFPCTDTSGLLSPTGNWLMGLDCGPFGCPPNGGWARFSQLSVLCRPSGDWVQRVTWTSLSCQPGVGACCMTDGTCEILTTTDCAAAGGSYQGDNTFCNQVSCPQPTGACCFSNNFCLELTASNCAGAGGSWLGPNTSCANGNTCPTGACCLPDGSCIITDQGDCTAQGGTFRGVGVTCANANCPPPLGACCFSNGFCLQLSQADCNGVPGAVWAGPLTDCATDCGCADCDDDTICDEDENDCDGNGQPDDCQGSFCEADLAAPFGILNVFDFLAFQTAFSNSDPCADLAAPNGTFNVFDFLSFQTAFGNGC